MRVNSQQSSEALAKEDIIRLFERKYYSQIHTAHRSQRSFFFWEYRLVDLGLGSSYLTVIDGCLTTE